jgi:lysophospholipase L1-like esterase
VKIARGSKLLFIGDSITDCGRAQPAGEGLFDALGRGYVAQVDALLGAVRPELGIRVVNQGASGNTVRDLKARWQRDVMDLKPDGLSVMIGINDVWRQFDSPRQTEIHVTLPEYEQTLAELVDRSQPTVEGMVLMTPFYIEPNRDDAMRAQMDRYGAVVRKIAEHRHTLFVDTQAAFDEVLAHYYPATLAWDRVHPGQTGHMVIARAFLHAIGFTWEERGIG